MTEAEPVFEKAEDSGRSGIVRKGQRYFASLGVKSSVPIATEIGKNIEIALRVQEKVDEAVRSGNRSGFLKVIAMLNCRKTVFAVTESKSVQELTTSTTGRDEDERPMTSYELSAIPELLQDLKRITDLGKVPVLGTGESLEIEIYLERNPSLLPAIVHVFEIKSESEGAIISALMKSPALLSNKSFLKFMRLNHTFLAFDKDQSGQRVCFHKQGPKIDHRFELTDLDSLTQLTITPEPGHMYLSFIGPAPWRRTQDTEMQQTG